MTDPTALARLRVVLCETSHPGNIGAAARAMKTMGVTRLALVDPRHFPDPQAQALASGAADVLEQATVCPSLDEALAGTVASYAFTARRRELAGRVLSVREAAVEAAERAGAGDVALLFGNETSGLSNEQMLRCTALAYIPTSAGYSSLNLGAAVQVACYEARMAAGAIRRGSPAFAPATYDEIEKLYAHAARTLIGLSFLDPRRPRRLLPRLRRLFARTGLEREEVHILRGILAAADAALARACAPRPTAGDRPGAAEDTPPSPVPDDRAPDDPAEPSR